MDLTDYRKQIDAIDSQMVALFRQRMEIAAEFAAYKQANGLPVLDAARERQKLDSLCAQVPPELRECLETLYTALFQASRAYKERCMSGV